MHARFLSVVTLLLLWVGSGLVYAGWTDPVPVTEVNIDGTEEWSPFLSFDGLTLYFARVRSADFYDGRIFQATRERPYGPFTRVEEIPGTLNLRAGHDVCPWVSPDNLRMYYHNEDGGVFSLKFSERASVDDPWAGGASIIELNELGNRLAMPRLTADELVIVFGASDIDGGEGGYDLWMADRPTRLSPFGNVRNLATINTQWNDATPYISPDGLQLYFSSNRNGNMQLFKAQRVGPNASFDTPIHLSVFDVPGGYSAHPALASDGTTIYYQRQIGSNRSTRDIYISRVGPDYYVDGRHGSDSSDGLSPHTALATIRKAIELAQDGDVVGVYPGVYREAISFSGKAITVESVADAPVLEVPGDFAVSFSMGEGPDSVLKNFVITNSYVGIFIFDASPTIMNVTVTGNEFGVEVYRDPGIEISSSILWGNAVSDLHGCGARYSCVPNAPDRIWGDWGPTMSEDPLFVDPDNGDYHLRSERGRYWSEHDVWVLDDVMSPCIDGGDPSADISMERLPNGGRLNMGAYGGTALASMSESPFRTDFNGDRAVDANDLELFIDVWEKEMEEAPLTH